MGLRLVEERERACDEEVLRVGNQPEVYAESILKTCEFYLESPLPCMSGISGSDLKQRIVRIMSQHLAMKLSFSRKLLLAAAGFAAVALPVAVGLMNAPQGRAQSQRPSFEVASIKPNKSADGRVMIMNRPGGRFSATGITVKMLMGFAYNVKDDQISGATGWMDTDHFDIEAKEEAPAADAPKLSPEEQMEQRRLMLQSLLADRFKLTLRHETKELPVYALVVAKGGPKLKESADPPADPGAPPVPPPPPGPPNGGPPPRGMIQIGSGNLAVNGIELRVFADVLSRQIGRIVLDKTGLTGKYEFTLKWTPDERQGQMFKGAGDGGAPRDTAAPPEAGPSIFTALQDQLGLKLESQKAPVDLLVIERIERPSAN
jgi:bla regulator protein BlaR1